MIEVQLWMFPIVAAAMIFAMHALVMRRLRKSEERWLREHEKAQSTAAE
jgi:cytochrome c-type biogenesis protein CcmH/NrfF